MRPSRILAALAVALTLVLAACATRGGTPAEDPGSDVRTIDVGGLSREYRVHVPQRLAAEPALVVMLHGGFGSAAQAEAAYGWDRVAEREGFVVAYPDAEGRSWNAGDCCGRSAATDVDDVGFVSAVVATLQQQYGIDPAHTFATGMSNGAMLSYRLACDTDLFAAIAPVAGTIVTPCDGPAPVSVLEIHGLDDQTVRMDGEPGSGTAVVDGMPVEDVIELWRSVDGCGEPVVTTQDPVTTSTSSCPDGRTVELITIAGAGHQWPGSASGWEGGDPPSDALDATATIWEFFAAA